MCCDSVNRFVGTDLILCVVHRLVCIHAATQQTIIKVLACSKTLLMPPENAWQF
jgi:hypothetical protein